MPSCAGSQKGTGSGTQWDWLGDVLCIPSCVIEWLLFLSDYVLSVTRGSSHVPAQLLSRWEKCAGEGPPLSLSQCSSSCRGHWCWPRAGRLSFLQMKRLTRAHQGQRTQPKLEPCVWPRGLSWVCPSPGAGRQPGKACSEPVTPGTGPGMRTERTQRGQGVHRGRKMNRGVGRSRPPLIIMKNRSQRAAYSSAVINDLFNFPCASSQLCRLLRGAGPGQQAGLCRALSEAGPGPEGRRPVPKPGWVCPGNSRLRTVTETGSFPTHSPVFLL